MWRTISQPLSSIFSYQKLIRTSSYVGKLNPILSSQLVRKHCCKCCNNSNFNGSNKGNRHRRGGPYQQQDHDHNKYDWSDVLGWSGVLLLGWYICHPCRYRQIPTPLDKKTGNPVPDCLKVLTQVLATPAHCVLPADNFTSIPDQENTLKQGLQHLEIAHGRVESSLSNWLGMECMRAGRHKDAFAYFSTAANVTSSAENTNAAAALFNLGICHEMGIGTTQDFRMAAMRYRQASDLGHATAMYNLGVFHVHGWGGVDADVKQARTWFERAAKLGQLDARKALNENEEDNVSNKNENEQAIFNGIFLVEPEDNAATEEWFKSLNVTLPQLSVEQEVDKFCPLTSVDSGVDDLSPIDNDLMELRL